MDKCLLHDEEAKRTCVKCKKRFCEKCAALTEYSGLCPECERDKQRRIYDYALKKKTMYLSNALAFLIGALAFLAAGFIFTDFKTESTGTLENRMTTMRKTSVTKKLK